MRSFKIFVLIALTHSLLSPSGEQISYPTLFCHGLHAGPLQAAKYIRCHRASTTGQIIKSPRAVDFLSEPLCVPVFPEIDLRNSKTDTRRKILFCKMVHCFDKKLYGYRVQNANISGPTLEGRGFHIGNNNFGQQADLAVIKSAYEQHKKENPQHKMLLWGCSRGAAAACTFMCTEADDTAQHVQLVVLEGCFDSSVSVIEKRFKRWGKRGISWIKAFFEKNTLWRENGISPLAVLHKWPEHVPVLFVTSRKDTVVPMECTINCVKQLKALKPNLDIYLLVLDSASHSGYVFDNAKDRALYERTVNAFYKKYGWKHDPKKAACGMRYLETIKQ